MSLDTTLLFLSFIPSGIGFVLFVYGKKQVRLPQIVSGLLLMVYPFFATSVASLAGGGAIIGVGLWWALRMGW